MAQTGRRMNREEMRGQRGQYVHGSAAPKVDIRRQIQEVPSRHVSANVKKNRAKARNMSPVYVIYLMVALFITGIILVNYVNLCSRLTNQVATINRMESQLNKMRLDNDEELNRVNNKIDLEEIKRIAIGELGMTYAQEGQIVTYSGEGADYMRKVVED